MIKVENLTYSVSDRIILDNLNVSINKSETYAVMGMSGAGKSTLLKCIAKLIDISSGNIYINGKNISILTEPELVPVRRQIGMVFQYAALFDSLNIFENVAFGIRRLLKLSEGEIRETVMKKLDIVGLKNVEAFMPNELSGGMQKRVGLARALAMEPDIILYDEPTAGLDPITSATIADLIKKTRDELGVTSILVSHDIPTIVGVSSKISMLHQGKIIASGTPKEMINSEIDIVKKFISGNRHCKLTIDQN